MDDSMSSASAVIDVVLRHIPTPRTVVDVGCGIGTWLRVWEDKGVEVLGLDGDYVNRDQLLIDPGKFRPMELSRPISLDRKFDLAESLEVAEHLHDKDADAFVDFLCSLSSIILFSAAIPHQGGDHHVNEQWPEYWAGKFEKKGYVCIDAIRDQVWTHPGCVYYYAQNTFLYIDSKKLDQYPSLMEIASRTDSKNLARVHPRKWIQQVEGVARLEYLLIKLPASSTDFVRRAFRKIMRMTKSS
jgi:SAM-dependent methyltransferase